MTAAEGRLREDLAALAASNRGRRLLQLGVQAEWDMAVERLLVEVLGDSEAEAVTGTGQVAAGV